MTGALRGVQGVKDAPHSVFLATGWGVVRQALDKGLSLSDVPGSPERPPRPEWRKAPREHQRVRQQVQGRGVRLVGGIGVSRGWASTLQMAKRGRHCSGDPPPRDYRPWRKSNSLLIFLSCGARELQRLSLSFGLLVPSPVCAQAHHPGTRLWAPKEIPPDTCLISGWGARPKAPAQEGAPCS